MSFVAYGWCIVGIPLANLLIGGGGICYCLPVTNSHATHQLKAARVAQIAEFVASGSVVCALWVLFVPAVPTVTQGFC